MDLTHINNLKPGMILDEEVRDINERLLLKKDKKIQSSRIRIFKIWGVAEVNVQGGNGNKNPSAEQASPEHIEKIAENTKRRLILYSYFPAELRNILSRARTSEQLLYLQEKDYLGCNRTHLVKDLFQQWKLPMVLENIVFYHHNPKEAQHPQPAALVHLADIITNGLGIDTSGERFVSPLDN
ncbi:MAG: HDOD domain-containing protein, partial [Desulfobacterales bacterium]|nr:HDOD domain-containing protein [Desulfobacterales bacterium]